MTRSNSLSADTAGFVQPAILILFHMPKTGGTTMGSILERCFPGDLHFNADVGEPDSSTWTLSRAKIAEKYNLLPAEAKQSFRAVIYGHVPMGIHILFDRPAKYFTFVRHPVDRVVSQFYYMRTQSYLPIFERIQNMTLDQYLDSGLGLDPFDHQVRMLSGCEELDGPYGIDGQPVPAVPVEGRHLHLAKQNIETHFLAAAPFQEFTAVVILLKRLYGWRLRQCLFEVRRATERRPRVADLSAATRRHIEDCNRHDMELYDWTKRRFADQIRALEPRISRDRRLFNIVNKSWQRAGHIMTGNLRARITNLLLHT
jgi:hypothetical protein